MEKKKLVILIIAIVLCIITAAIICCITLSNKNKIESMELILPDFPDELCVGDTYDFSKAYVLIIYGDGSSKQIEVKNINGFNTDSIGQITIIAETDIKPITKIVMVNESPKFNVIFYVDGMEYSKNIIERGKCVEELEIPNKKHYIAKFWALNGEEYDFSKIVKENIVLNAVYEKKIYNLKFVDGQNIINRTVNGGDALGELPLIEKDGYIFNGWYYDNILLTAKTIIENDIKAIAKWSMNLETAKAFAANELTSIFNNMDLDCYVYADRESIIIEYDKIMISIKKANSVSTVLNLYEKTKTIFEGYKTILDSFIEYIEIFKQEDYYENEWNTILQIQTETIERLKNFKNNVPTRETIVNNAIHALNKILTKQQDIENAELLKILKSRELRNMVSIINKKDYTDSQLTEIENCLNESIENIMSRIGTAKVMESYLLAIEKLNALLKI